jgi:hypothetical protein
MWCYTYIGKDGRRFIETEPISGDPCLIEINLNQRDPCLIEINLNQRDPCLIEINLSILAI